MKYLFMMRPQLKRSYLFSKIHKRKSNVPDRAVKLNDQTVTENIYSFLDFNLT